MMNIYDVDGLRMAVLENGIWTGFIYDRGTVIAELDAGDAAMSPIS